MANRPACRYTGRQTDADCGPNQRHSSPALGRALVGAQDRPASAHRPPHPGQVPGDAGATTAPRQRASKLDPFKPTIAEWLTQDPTASAVVIAQRLRPLGFDGGMSILKEHLHAARGQITAKRAYVRMEPAAGERFEIDWGHFGALLYQGHARKLYAFCLVECHSRKLYVEFTHSQSFETFVRCHLHAFQAMGGVARE